MNKWRMADGRIREPTRTSVFIVVDVVVVVVIANVVRIRTYLQAAG